MLHLDRILRITRRKSNGGWGLDMSAKTIGTGNPWLRDWDDTRPWMAVFTGEKRISQTDTPVQTTEQPPWYSPSLSWNAETQKLRVGPDCSSPPQHEQPAITLLSTNNKPVESTTVFVTDATSLDGPNTKSSLAKHRATPSRPRGYKTLVQAQTQNKAQWLAACGHVSANSQSLRFILNLRMNSSFITSRPGHCISSHNPVHSFNPKIQMLNRF